MHCLNKYCAQLCMWKFLFDRSCIAISRSSISATLHSKLLFFTKRRTSSFVNCMFTGILLIIIMAIFSFVSRFVIKPPSPGSLLPKSLLHCPWCWIGNLSWILPFPVVRLLEIKSLFVSLSSKLSLLNLSLLLRFPLFILMSVPSIPLDVPVVRK